MNKRYGIMIVSVTILVLGFLGTASATNWTVNGSGGDADFTGIQEAINNASDGDTIIVHSGVYYENVVVNKSVTLKGIGQPIVDGSRWFSAITLTADGITLTGFTATNGSGVIGGAGIAVASNNNNITGNNARHNSWGIQLYDSCNNNTITGNNLSNNYEYGILFSTHGYHLPTHYHYLPTPGYHPPFSRSNNTITGNNVCNSEWGISLHDSNNNTITGNNVCNNEREGICLHDSSNNTITGNTLSNSYKSIWLCDSSNNSITGNNVRNNRYGISLSCSSNNNTITDNNVRSNRHGIKFRDSSSNNIIYFNNFINNTDVDPYPSASTNIWNSPLERTYTYNGTIYESYLGNYWDDYEGTDADGDGIGNTPYSINSEKEESDDYPLMKPFENYYSLTSAYT